MIDGAALEARHLEAGDETLLVLFNHGPSPARADVSLQRPAGPIRP